MNPLPTKPFRNAGALPCAVLLSACALTAAAEELAVPGDYDGIQAAVEAAQAGDVIRIDPGTYRANVVIDKEIELRGNETARTLVEAADSGLPALQINSTGNVVIRNLTFNTGPVGVSVTNSTNIDIVNNVFELGSGNGVEITDTISTGDIIDNSFVNNATAIVPGGDFRINTNIFSSNEAPVPDTAVVPDATGNCFDDGQAPFGDDTVEGDIVFADSEVHDYHLVEGSECLNTAGDADNAGAYHGSLADIRPFPPQNVNASNATAGDPPVYAVSIEWDENRWYRTGGYMLYYGSSESGVYEGTDARDGSGLIVESPVDVDDVTEFTLEQLSAPNDAPDAPELNEALPGNEQLTLNWSAVPRAEGYRVHYGLGSPDENSVDVGDVTTYTLGELQNGSVYRIQVSAVSQATYYLAVSTVDDRGNEGALSEEQTVSVGEALESDRSGEITATPEEVVPYPDLPDQGDSRCFIATAAYLHPDAPEVMALRAFRDAYLLDNPAGRRVVHWYYTHSPALAGWLDAHPGARPWMRGALSPAVWLARTTTEPRAALLIPPLLGLSGLVLLYAGFRKSREE